MYVSGMESPPSFTLHIRCTNCLAETSREVSVPDAEDAPREVDDLLDSNFLASLQFCCRRCKGNIGQLFAANKQ